MISKASICWRWVTLSAVAVAMAAVAESTGLAAERCCFTHPGYAGVCVVEPTGEETCESILAYLNNPRSHGKTYCKNTDIRGGWKRVACRDEGGKNAVGCEEVAGGPCLQPRSGCADSPPESIPPRRRASSSGVDSQHLPGERHPLALRAFCL